MSEKYKVRNQEKIHFIRFAVVRWIDVFTRRDYKEILIDSLKCCQQEKGLEIYAWCIMSNHLHLAVGTTGLFPLPEIIRDFKKYTSVAIIRAISDHPQESRKEWLLALLQKAAENSNKHQKYQFWQNQYHPIELTGNDQQQRCLDYIHQNPVEAGVVWNTENYVYSSAIDYAGGKGLLDILFIE